MSYLTACLAAGALAAGAAGGYQLASIKHERLAAAVQQEAQEQAAKARAEVDAANLKAHKAARRYEAWKAAQKPRVITITREVESEIRENPGWSDAPVPDGLRSTLEAAAASLGAAEPEPAVPAVPDPRAFKEL